MFSLGIDFGTSGARAIAIDATEKVVAQSACLFEQVGPADSLTTWKSALFKLLARIAPDIRPKVERIAINGTSATMLLCDRYGQPLSAPLMYNDAIARSALDEVHKLAPPGSSAVLSATSTLTKALWLYRNGVPDTRASWPDDVCIIHQADWLASCLHERQPVSDYHNALKLGYDVKALSYPDWLLASPIASWLPEVRSPGDAIAPISQRMVEIAGFPSTCQVCAGTTDSTAAFLASGATQPGEAVTSLGSTLVLKLLSPEPVDAPDFGIYSHRLGDLWLVGGASNTGGAVLKQFFSSEQLANLSRGIDINQPCDLDYYPLNSPGERFPINDPDYPPRLTPRPKSDRAFLHGLLDGMARIEAEGYQKLKDLHAPALKKVYTAGGGAKNETWRTIRQQKLGVDVVAATQTEAAYGTALLAMHGLSRFQSDR